MAKKKTEEKSDIDMLRIEINDWLSENSIIDKFAAQYTDQGYLTEGDVINVLNFDSKLDNPFRFFCGDITRYKEDLTIVLKHRYAQIRSFDVEKSQMGVLSFLTTQAHLLDEALNNAPLVEYKENTHDISERKNNESVNSVNQELCEDSAQEAGS